MKEGMDCVKDVKLDYVPVLLIKEGRDAIRTKSFVKAKLEHSKFNFLISNRTIKQRELMTREFWNG